MKLLLAMQPITDEMLIGSLPLFIRAVIFATRDRRFFGLHVLRRRIYRAPAEELPLLPLERRSVNDLSVPCNRSQDSHSERYELLQSLFDEESKARE